MLMVAQDLTPVALFQKSISLFDTDERDVLEAEQAPTVYLQASCKIFPGSTSTRSLDYTFYLVDLRNFEISPHSNFVRPSNADYDAEYLGKDVPL